MKNKPIPFPVPGREEVFYSLLDEEKLLELFALCDRLGYSDYANQIGHEIRKRGERGEMEIFNHPPTPVTNIPGWLKKWPFSLFWSQRPQRGRGGS
jgi:hypothetical protein